MRTTTVRTAVAVVALVAVIAGCGRGDGTEEVAVVRDLDLLQAAEAAGSARMAYSVETTMQTFGSGDARTRMHMTSEGEGVIGFATEEVRWSGTSAMEATAPEGSVDAYVTSPPMNVEVIQDADTTWSRGWVDGEEPPGWTEMPTSDDDDEDPDDEDTGLVPGGGSFDPTAFLGRLREQAGTVTAVGPEELRGDPTTRYRAEVDAEVLDLDDEAGDGSTVVDVWIDDEDRLRKIEAEGMQLELWDFGAAVDATPPTDVTGPGDVGIVADALPALTGDWETATSGTTGETGWTVFAAPGEVFDTATTCRTLEIDGAGTPGGLEEIVGDDVPFPVHGTALASCGNGLVAMATVGFVAAPALQVLKAGTGLTGFDGEGTALVGFVVAPEHAADGITLVREDAEPVTLALDAAGVAVWDGTGSPAITAVELDGGAVSCTFGFGEEGDAGAFDPGAMTQWIGFVPPVCVAA